LATDTENAQFVKQITDRLAQLPIKEQALAELQSKLDQYSDLEQQLQNAQKALEAAQSNVKQLENMNASVVASNARLSESNVKLSQQLKLVQMGIPQQMRSGIGAHQPVFDEADLREFEEVQGGYQHVSGGYDSTTYTPIIAAATGSLLWWGFGGLLVFLILIVIYLLGREIYRTQFKSETDRKNIK
jgi:multidrug efflux pump subunit AcrA (membrane-fusion protein)